MLKRWMQRLRKDPYDDAYVRSRRRRLERERRAARELGALRVFTDEQDTGTLPQLRA